MNDIKHNLATTLNWERRGRRGRRVNDLIEIMGWLPTARRISKALMAEKQGFHLSVCAEPLTNLASELMRLPSDLRAITFLPQNREGKDLQLLARIGSTTTVTCVIL